MITAGIHTAAAALLAAHDRALYGLRATAEADQVNGHLAASYIADTLTQLAAVDVAERALVLALAAAGVAPTVLARQMRIAPATLQRWVAEEWG
jgi:hypothetical protein